MIFFTIVSLLNGLTSSPFSIKKEYVSMQITRDGNQNIKDVPIIKNEIKKILNNDKDIIVVKVSDNSDRIFVYDPSCFLSCNFKKGYFSENEFLEWQSHSIIVDEDSAYNQMIMNNIIYFDGEYRDVIDTYSFNNPMKIIKNGCYTIQTISSDNDLTGTYYFFNNEISMVNKISDQFIKQGYQVTYLHKESKIKELFRNIEVITMIPSILIIIFADFTTLCLLFSKAKRTITIHFNFGATKGRLFLFQLREIMFSVIVGSLIGVLIGEGILYFIYNEWFHLVGILTFVITTVLILSIYLIAYFWYNRRFY
jgi:hypothetical protein